MRLDDTPGGAAEQARQDNREKRLREAHARIGSPSFTEEDWIEIAIQKLGYVDPKNIPAEVGRLLEGFYLEHMRGEQLNPKARTPAELARLEAIRTMLYQRLGFLEGDKPKAPRFTLMSTGPVSLAVEHGDEPGSAHVFLHFPATLRPLPEELEEEQRETVARVREALAHLDELEDDDPVRLEVHLPELRGLAISEDAVRLEELHELGGGWWIRMSDAVPFYFNRLERAMGRTENRGARVRLLDSRGGPQLVDAQEFVSTFARVELREGDLPPVGTWWRGLNTSEKLGYRVAAVKPCPLEGDEELCAFLEDKDEPGGLSWCRASRFVTTLEEAPPA